MMGTFWDNRIDVLEQLKTSDIGYSEQLLEVLIKAEREQLRRIIVLTDTDEEYRTIGALLQDGLYKLDPWMHESCRPWTNGDSGHTWVLLNLENLNPEDIARMNPVYQILTAIEAPPTPDVILYTEFVEHGLEAQKPWHDKGYYIAAKDHVMSKGAIMSMIGPPPKPVEAEELTLFEAADELNLESVYGPPYYRIQRSDGTLIYLEPTIDEVGGLKFDPPIKMAPGDRLIQGHKEKSIYYKRVGEKETDQ